MSPPNELDTLRHDANNLSTQLSRASSREEALEIAINAAETSMKALKLAQDPVEKTHLSTRVKQLLQEAERIKTSSDWKRNMRPAPASVERTTSSAPAKALKEPKSSRALPKSEQILLLKASMLNGFKFPPWTAPPAPSEFELKPGDSLFEDSTVLGLSAFQQEVFDGWRRPAEALPPPCWFTEDRTNLGPCMEFMRKIDLVQDAATDCSVVASLCAGVARAEKGHARLMREVIHPYDSQLGRPKMSENGKHVVRLNFNGCYRRVVIDDTLPTSKTGRVIHVIDRHNPCLLWPALIEKAYLKVRGGYDFPGSNSATDLWIISGWLPEQVFLQSDDLEPDTFWRRTLSAFTYGDVMVTMGTGKISARAEREIGLAGEHDYAVLDMRDCDGQRLFLIKNPWCEGTSWRGRFKQQKLNERPLESGMADMALLGADDEDEEPLHSSRDLLNSDDQLSPGTFWMDLDNVIQYFESIYLNWNPGLFAFRQDLHFSWNLSDDAAVCGRYRSLRHHPQFVVTPETSGTIWLILCRHFRNTEISDPSYGHGARPELDIGGFISLHAFRAEGHRVLLPDNVFEKSNFVDSPQILLKLDDCQAGRPITLVPGEQELPPVYLTFTLNAFSNSSFSLNEAQYRYAHSKEIPGAWTKDSAGGNAHSQAYSTNPQFSITVSHKTPLTLLLEAADDALNVHLKLVHGRGERIRSVRNRDIVVDSKDYRPRCCVANANLVEAGTYTIICSTFEPNQLSQFTLLAESAHPVKLALLPKEGAGRLRTALPIASFPHGANKLAVPLIPTRLINLYFLAQHLSKTATASNTPTTSSGCLLRVTIELSRGSAIHHTLASSGDGEYSDPYAGGGVQSESLDLSPEMRRRGDLWLVLERMGGASGYQGRDEAFLVESFADLPDGLSWGIWRAWEE